MAPVTAATVVPTISFALNPSLESAGTKTTAPPKPVIADTIPAKEPDAAENAALEAGVDNDSAARAAAFCEACCAIRSYSALFRVFSFVVVVVVVVVVLLTRVLGGRSTLPLSWRVC